MDIVKIVAIAIVCALLCAVLKQYKPEFAIVVQLAASVFILLLIASAMGDLISAVKDLINGSGINTESSVFHNMTGASLNYTKL